MDRFNSNEDPEITALSIARQIVYSDDYNNRAKAVQIFAKELDEAYRSGWNDAIDENRLDAKPCQ